MILREATRHDLFSIAKVQVHSNRSTYVGIMPEDYLNNLSYESKANEWDEKLFKETVTQFMYVVEAGDGNIVAFASASLIRTNDLFEREVNSIYILKEFQRKGIGRLLIKSITTKFIEIDVKSMIIWTLEDNPSQIFYKHLGGNIVDRRIIDRGGKSLQQIAYAWEDITCIFS
ncbi:GNAT family N-acetyltransferase [Clostridium estertheticum]|uniref:GNAT family N-acetyltransferase n=1 Tax=Clostridium estertheticum TaxID=238834 RepID=UPI001C7D5AE9|nr:GNAT family N-acetyltransferase [Clostridium estertheticum]MBX4267962.1 GNAT family N-acetyltransferase [Clostridium estertheticum]WLC78190.1 GNAT family N-acetyltransferase [Clostridium estertheticum]